MTAKIAEEVQRIIERLLLADGPNHGVARGSSILELGFDSLRIAELTVALEEGLGIAAFPMQEWADAENLKTGERFTVGSIIDVCVALLADEVPEGLYGREAPSLV